MRNGETGWGPGLVIGFEKILFGFGHVEFDDL